MRKLSTVTLLLVLVPTLFFASAANAALAENFGVGSPKALSLGHAVTADPPGIDSIHFNPAGLARLKGRQYLLKLIYPDIGMEATIYHPTNDVTTTFADGTEMGMFDFVCGKGLNRPFRDPIFYDDVYGENAEAQFAEDCTNGTPPPPVHSTAGPAIFFPGIDLQPMSAAIGPGGGASYSPPGSKFTFGTSVYMREGNLVARDEDDPARYEGEAMGMVRFTYFSPTIAMQYNDELSFGLGIHFSWQGVAMKFPLRVAHLGLAVVGSFQNVFCEDPNGDGNWMPKPGASSVSEVADVCGGYFDPYTQAGYLEMATEKAVSTSIFMGMLWDPTPWLSVGVVYIPEVRDKLEGTFEFRYSENWSGLFQGMNANGLFSTNIDNDLLGIPYGHESESGKATVEFVTPAHFAMGIALRLTPSLQLNIDAKWTDYAAWDVLPVGLSTKDPQGVDLLRFLDKVTPWADRTTLSIPFQFDSVWNWAFGLRYLWSEALELRMGYEPRRSSIPENRYSLFAPFGDSDLYGLGFSYSLDKDTHVDFALSYLVSEVEIPPNSSTLVNSTDPNELVLNPYAGSYITGKVEAWILGLSIEGHF